MVRSWAPHVPRGTRRHLETPRIPWSSSLSLLAPFRSREHTIRRLSDADGFPHDPLHEAITCAQVSCLFVHEVSERHGPAGCEVVLCETFSGVRVSMSSTICLCTGGSTTLSSSLTQRSPWSCARRSLGTWWCHPTPYVGTPVLVDVNVHTSRYSGKTWHGFSAAITDGTGVKYSATDPGAAYTSWSWCHAWHGWHRRVDSSTGTSSEITTSPDMMYSTTDTDARCGPSDHHRCGLDEFHNRRRHLDHCRRW